MNDDDLTVGTIVKTIDDTYGMVSGNGVIPLTMTTGTAISSNTVSTIKIPTHFDVSDFLEEHIMSRVTVDHKVQEQELMKLKEVAPDYANEIKENLSKNAARDIIKKMAFTKKHDKDADVHHFIGRVWVFTEEELKNLINEARNA